MLEQVAQRGGICPILAFLSKFKARLDRALSGLPLLKMSLFISGGVGLDDLKVSFPAQTVL